MRASLPRLKIGGLLITLCSVLVFAHLALSFWWPDLATQNTFENLGLLRQDISSGRLWTLFSYSLFHHPLEHSHVTLNTAGLFFLAGRVAYIFSPKTAYLILLSGVLTGGIVHLLIDPLLRNSELPLIGISGGIFALFATLATVSPDSRFWPLPIRADKILFSCFLICLISITLSPDTGLPFCAAAGRYLSQIGLASVFEISHSCHLGGLLSGVVFARRLIALPKAKKIKGSINSCDL